MFNSRQKQMEDRIAKADPGAVFVLADFTEIANPKTVSKVMTRLEESGLVSRVLRGVFWKPDPVHSNPNPDEVAHALARGNIWRLAPCGQTALHVAGLSEEQPREWTYVTDGTYRKYSFNGIDISFRHASGKTFSAMSEKAALLVQILKAYGEKHITEDLLSKLKAYFRPDEQKKILEETKHTTAWVAHTIARMFRKKELAK